MKILIADDSRVMRQIVIRTLRQAGYDGHELIEAGNGAEALDLVQSRGTRPRAVGLEHAGDDRHRAAARPALARTTPVPFGFVTSEGTPEMRAIAEEAGALFLIAKPFTPDSLPRPPRRGGRMTTASEWVLTPSPPALEARELLSGLLGREVTCSRCRRPSSATSAPGRRTRSTRTTRRAPVRSA